MSEGLEYWLGNMAVVGARVIQIHQPPSVGGVWIPVDKFGLLAPYIALASTIVVATVAAAICVKYAKRRKKKQ
ncbi:MAG: hypothetical protein AOA66_0717 [Candidatus Bathyarchaeota archaeon BA2]|nr:MAG: hypothetical protein AOA66_0717 [Candidatus Bathyarchaeota archaeon BA2]